MELNIPEKIKVGYQKRESTYTGKLAYVVYLDSKGKLAKEKSWENWRDKDIEPSEFDNIPTEGFVLNKKTGDYYFDRWEHRKAYCRVYDPRDFEIEITIDNLLYILENCDCTKGKGLEGSFVYSWSGTELVLLPVSSPNYKTSIEAMKKKENLTGSKLIPGSLYKTKDNGNLVYIGKELFTYIDSDFLGNEYNIIKRKEHLFIKGKKPMTLSDARVKKNIQYKISDSLSLSEIEDWKENNYKNLKQLGDIGSGFKFCIEKSLDTKNVKNEEVVLYKNPEELVNLFFGGKMIGNIKLANNNIDCLEVKVPNVNNNICLIYKESDKKLIFLKVSRVFDYMYKLDGILLRRKVTYFRECEKSYLSLDHYKDDYKTTRYENFKKEIGGKTDSEIIEYLTKTYYNNFKWDEFNIESVSEFTIENDKLFKKEIKDLTSSYEYILKSPELLYPVIPATEYSLFRSILHSKEEDYARYSYKITIQNEQNEVLNVRNYHFF